MLHVNEFLAHEVGRIAVLFPTGEDDVAQALGIGVLHAFLPGGKAQVVPRSLGRVGPGASVRHGQDAAPDAGRVDARGVLRCVDFQAVARIEVQGAVLRDGQAVTGFDAPQTVRCGRAIDSGLLSLLGGFSGFDSFFFGPIRLKRRKFYFLFSQGSLFRSFCSLNRNTFQGSIKIAGNIIGLLGNVQELRCLLVKAFTTKHRPVHEIYHGFIFGRVSEEHNGTSGFRGMFQTNG